ncbi:MAG: protein kinase [Armatimonadota bacterium]|nr:protein kinase [Armatimonadota bacterium]
MSGQNIGRFQIIREIGRGAAAVVYEALDPRIGRPVALKVLAVGAGLTGAVRREAIERFYREARSAGKLSHPNVAQVYDVGEDAGRHYIAMELCHGVSLRDVLRFEGRIQEARLKFIALQILNALEAAHAVGIVHRDVKPENIIIGPKDLVKLTDFGIAKALGESTMTQTGVMLGTPAYMSPEQVLGRSVDARSDLFSLGAVLYECLSGRKAFDGESITAVTHKVAYVDPEPLKGVAPPWPDIVMKLLAKSPANRYQCATDVLSDIRADRSPVQPQQQLPSASQQGVQPQQASQTLQGAGCVILPPSVSAQQPTSRCPRCGSYFSGNFLSCPYCGQPQRALQVPPPYPSARNIPDNLGWAILVTLFFCLPLGIVSIAKAIEANAKKASGDYDGAYAAYHLSRFWMWASVLFGICVGFFMGMLSAIEQG